jgi:hypothetical protein
MGLQQELDAIELVNWYEKQAHTSTLLNDNEIALQLTWTRGGGQRGRENQKGKAAIDPYGDAARVRRARRHVDHDKTGLFAEYWFGTRMNGGGRSLSRLHVRDSDADQNGVVQHCVEEIARLNQMVKQHESERERRILPTVRELTGKLQQDQAPVSQILAMHDVMRDIEGLGRITPATQWALIKAGIKWA